jgi:hypothetical protein
VPIISDAAVQKQNPRIARFSAANALIVPHIIPSFPANYFDIFESTALEEESRSCVSCSTL